MKFAAKPIFACLVFVAGVAYGADAVEPTVKAWQELMDANGGAAKTLGGMASGEVAFDAAAAEAAKAVLVANSVDIATKFKVMATDPASKGKPAIWEEWAKFEEYAGKLNAAATALDASTLDGVKAGMGAVGGACKDCHTEFKS